MAARSRVGTAWAPRKSRSNFRCPLCGSAVRYVQVRGNLSPQIECSDPACPWILEDLIREPQVIQDTKPKGISSRQWYQSKGVA